MPPECGTVTSQSQPMIEIIKMLAASFSFCFILDTYPNKKSEEKKGEEYYSLHG